MRINNGFYYTRWYRYWMTYRQFFRIYQALSQVEELEQLIIWAKRKHLKRLVKNYQSKHLCAEIYLSNLALRERRIAHWARFIHYLVSQLLPEPIYKKGSASKYHLIAQKYPNRRSQFVECLRSQISNQYEFTKFILGNLA